MVFSQNEIIIMIGVVSVLLLCITILTILDLREYLKSKKGIVSEDMDFKEEYQEEDIKRESVQVVLEEEKEPEEVMVNNIKVNNDIFLEDMDDEKIEIKKEINPIIQEVDVEINPLIQEVNEEVSPVIQEVEDVVVKVPEIKKEIVIPQINEVEEEVLEPIVEKKEKKKLEIFEELDELEEKLPNKLDDVTNFEMEQERTAIISLDELLNKTDELYNDNEIVQYNDDDAPISIDEVISRFRQESEPESVIVKEEPKEVPIVMQEIDNDDVIVPYSRKETIPFISSVYGIEQDSNALEFENTATYEKLDRENYNDFVAKLREMNEKE